MSPIHARAFYTRYPHWGAYTGFQQVCRHLDPATVRLSLRAVSDSDEDWPIPPNPLNDRLRLRVQARGMAWYKLSDLAAEIAALPAALTNAVDIVHFLDAEHTGQYLPRWIKRWRGSRVKTVGTFHQPPEILPGLVDRDAVSMLDLVLVVSPTQEAFFHQCVPANRVRTMLHGVDTAFFRPRPVDGPITTRSVFKCITVGHWMRDWAAVRAVAEALSSDAGIELHIVTNRDTGLDGMANVKVHQNVGDERLRQLYQEADALFLPLTNSTANNSLLEGMACGLPVVSTRLQSVIAYVGDGPAALVEGNDRDELLNILLALRHDEARRRRMGRAGRARAEALAWPRVALELEGLYAGLVQD